MAMASQSAGLFLHIMQEECKRSPVPVHIKCPRCNAQGRLNARGEPVYGKTPGWSVKTCSSCKGSGRHKDPREFTKRLLRRFSKVDQTQYVDFFREQICDGFPGMDSHSIDTILNEEVSLIHELKNALLAQKNKKTSETPDKTD